MNKDKMGECSLLEWVEVGRSFRIEKFNELFRVQVKQFQKLVGYLPMNLDMFLADVGIKHVFLSEHIDQAIHLSVINITKHFNTLHFNNVCC